MPNAPGPLGWIDFPDRTNDQNEAHARSMAAMPAFSLPHAEPTGPVKVMLTDFWKRPEVVAEVGLEFNGFYQFTGSCVGVGGGNAVFTVAAIQRCIADNPTQAFIPWWPWPYGTTRLDGGSRGEGSGAIVSVMGIVLHRKGIFAAGQPGLPEFTRGDGMRLTSQLELQWSNGGKLDPKWKELAAPNTIGTMAPLSSTADIKSCIINGYPVLNGCSNFCGSGRIVGSGSDAYVVGKWDGRGGHCLAGGTKIPLLDGTEKTIKELADAGKPAWIYSYDHGTGRVIPKQATARLTRQFVPEGMVRVALDNGESVTATLDHRFMLRDGTYREAKDLRAGDSMMPLYRKLSDTKRHPGYEMVLDPGPMTWEMTHRRVAESVVLKSLRFCAGQIVEEVLPIDCRPVIHHVNFDKLDNTPSNLAKMVNREHWRYHSAVADGLWNRMDPQVASARKAKMGAWVRTLWDDPEYRAMMRSVSIQSIKKLWIVLKADPKLYAAHVEQSAAHLKSCWADPEWRAKKIAQVKEMMATPEAKEKIRAACRKKNVDLAFRKKVSAGQKRSWADPQTRASRVAVMKSSRQTPEYRAIQAAAQKKRWEDPDRRAIQSETTRLWWEQKRAATDQPVNHKVVSVEFLPEETGPTYCFHVEGTQNFAISAGVFVHNCTNFLGYWDHPTDGPLFLYSNQWPASTYPKDPAGAGRCCVWMAESEVKKLFSTGGSNGETMGLSHLNYFPAQPKVLDWFIAP